MNWDSIDSRRIINTAKSIYFKSIAHYHFETKPIGVIIKKTTGHGRVVCKKISLLPDELFISSKYIIPRATRTKSERLQERN